MNEMNNKMRKFKMYPYPLEMLVFKKNREISNGRKFVSYYIEFSTEELRKFSNNFIVINENDEYYIYPIDVIACGFKIRNNVFQFNVEDFKIAYDLLHNEYILSRSDYYKMDDSDFIFLTSKYIMSEIIRAEEYGKVFGFRNVYNNVVRKFNEFIEKNKRLPDNSEVKQMFIEYLSSYDVKEILESII